MADYEIIAVREGTGNGRTHYIAAVKVGESLFLADQIVDWINAAPTVSGCGFRMKRSM
ncbi:hypothetical protein [Sphingopyxis sp. SCN 67-31]|uniref:hypothetical protein n=1 Tax=Sphingopyxis sp. SCN 67-31 TaxID=1660142 RepID=UPI00257E9ED6|nr:hypothetical protein [Sphingopyxis sp. SCN 67-31]